MVTKRLPPVDPALIEWLEAKYPNRVPDIGDSDRKIWVAVGQQDLIAHLKGIIQRIVKENLGT